MRVTGYVNDREELYSRVKNGDIAIFGHFKDLDIWIPFEYDFQKSVKIIPKMTVEKSFGVEDTYFYERYVLAGNSDSGFCIELSDNLTVDLKHDKFIFEIKSDIEGVMRDINFLDAVCHGHRLISGEDNICEYSDPLFGSDMKQMVSDVKDFYAALKHFDFRITKSFSEFTNADFSAMNALIRLYRGEYRSNNTTEWYMWWWDGKVMPIFVAINLLGTVTIKESAVNRLFILPEYQSCGYGTQLMDFAEAKIAEKFSRVHIDSSLAAKEMYLKRGYKEKKTCIIPADNGDILIYDEMEKRVDKL